VPSPGQLACHPEERSDEGSLFFLPAIFSAYSASQR
jgi:hypothetical protein